MTFITIACTCIRQREQIIWTEIGLVVSDTGLMNW